MGRRTLLGAGAAALAATAAIYTVAQADPQGLPPANTPIQHVVIIFGENQSFDHYFATYPNAANPAGQPAVSGRLGSQKIDNLQTANLLGNNNPNSRKPRRLDRSEAVPCDFNHN